jgi:hypothetical protein
VTAVPIAFTATRYRCPFCSRSRSARKATAAHIERCWHNPEARGCKTCANYYPGDSGCGIHNPVCNCASPEMCMANVAAFNGPLIHCDQWEPEGVPDGQP